MTPVAKAWKWSNVDTWLSTVTSDVLTAASFQVRIQKRRSATNVHDDAITWLSVSDEMKSPQAMQLARKRTVPR